MKQDAKNLALSILHSKKDEMKKRAEEIKNTKVQLECPIGDLISGDFVDSVDNPLIQELFTLEEKIEKIQKDIYSLSDHPVEEIPESKGRGKTPSTIFKERGKMVNRINSVGIYENIVNEILELDGAVTSDDVIAVVRRYQSLTETSSSSVASSYIKHLVELNKIFHSDNKGKKKIYTIREIIAIDPSIATESEKTKFISKAKGMDTKKGYDTEVSLLG